jgi:hypothetical protein
MAVATLSGPERRRRWTQAEMLRLVEETLAAEANIAVKGPETLPPAPRREGKVKEGFGAAAEPHSSAKSNARSQHRQNANEAARGRIRFRTITGAKR